MDRRDRIEAALIGAYVADAAAMGLHWLYDADRVAALADGGLMFREPDPSDFNGFKGVFVHHGKHSGDQSQYGAQLRVAVQSVSASGGFDLTDFQNRFAATFSAGGSWVGYMDKATKGTLTNLAADRRDPSGADDDQVPAVSKLPAILAVPDLSETEIDIAITATNANETAVSHAHPLAAMLQCAYDGGNMDACLAAGAEAAMGDAGEAVRRAFDTTETDTAIFAGQTGRACPLPQALPVMIHIARHARTYSDAVERNVRAAGDTCGRSICLGALFGALHGLGDRGVPLRWIGQLTDLRALNAEIAAFTDGLT